MLSTSRSAMSQVLSKRTRSPRAGSVTQVRVVSMCGSLGSVSANQAALDIAAAHLTASGHTVVPVEQLAEVPAFRPELVDNAGAVVNGLRETLESCDGVLLAAPEYAGGLAGVVKNALDWMVGSASMYHRPVVVLSAGTTGGVFAREQVIRTLSWQGALVVDNLGVAAPRTKVDNDGRFVDPETIAEIEHWANQLIASIGAAPAERLALVTRVVAPYGIDAARFGELAPGPPLR